MSQPILPKGYNERGAFMGREAEWPNDRNAPIKLHLRNILTDGAYDQGGAYWGQADRTTNNGPVYWAHGNTPEEEQRGSPSGITTWVDSSVDLYVRAWSREEAKKKVLELLPNATFYT